MKNYRKAVFGNNFVKNLVIMGHVGDGEEPAEMLKRNSYALLNVSPRFFLGNKRMQGMTKVIRGRFR